jgi:type II secretory pathway pseudopilin PulG
MKLRNQLQAERAQENCIRAAAGFAFIELLVVIAVIALMAAMLLPTLSRARQQSAATQCLNNLKELALAWNMYVADNHGFFPANSEGGTGKAWIAGGEMNYSGSPDNTNLMDLVGPNSLISPYALKQRQIFKCPADLSCTDGTKGAPRIRTYSMNESIGYANGVTAGTGYWLPSVINGGPWMGYFKESDLSRPKPSMLWLFQEEDPDSINDAGFAFEMPTGAGGADTAWIDSPSKVHGNAGRFAFVDGHSEVHAWRNPLAVPNVTYSGAGGDPGNYPRKVISKNRDVWWVAARTSALASGAQNDFPSDWTNP